MALVSAPATAMRHACATGAAAIHGAPRDGERASLQTKLAAALALGADLASALRFTADASLRAYAQLLLSRSRAVGALVAAATFVAPALALHGALGALAATVAARLFGLSREGIRAGVYGYGSILVGLGVGALHTPGAGSLVLAVFAAALTVPLHAALAHVFASRALPVLTLPFLAALWLVVLAAPTLLGPSAPLPTAAEPSWATSVPAFAAFALRSLGALVFLPRVDAGFLVFAALVVSSRIATAHALMGAALAFAASEFLDPDAKSGALGLGCNGLLTMLAVGGVWFVPSLSSTLLAVAATALTGALFFGAAPLFRDAGLPLGILPFNLAVLAVLCAARLRERDQRPKSVDFLVGSPEENLGYHQSRVRRFGARLPIRLRAPFEGAWTCTQGVDGAHTHRGPWRHALDFEVLGDDGRPHRAGDGVPALADFHCYGRPVLAAADGTVVRVIDGVPDNAVGEVDLERNWGNLVLVLHAPSLYSLVAHLSPGTLAVREGQYVRRGERLGLCGSSGRSPIPHLHFQLQSTPHVGAETLPIELHDVVVLEGEPRLAPTHVPEEGETLRALEPRLELAALVDLPYGQPLPFVHDDGRREELVHEVELHGARKWRCGGSDALFVDRGFELFTAHDAIGRPDGLAQLLRAALPRLPFDAAPGLTFCDSLPWRALPRPPLWARLFGGQLEMSYRISRHGHRLVLRGESLRAQPSGEPLLRTELWLKDGLGPERVARTHRGRTTVVHREGTAPPFPLAVVR